MWKIPRDLSVNFTYLYKLESTRIHGGLLCPIVYPLIWKRLCRNTTHNNFLHAHHISKTSNAVHPNLQVLCTPSNVTVPFKSVMYNQTLCLLLSSRHMHSAVARSCYPRTLLGLGIRSRHKTCDIDNQRQPPLQHVLLQKVVKLNRSAKMSMRNDSSERQGRRVTQHMYISALLLQLVYHL